MLLSKMAWGLEVLRSNVEGRTKWLGPAYVTREKSVILLEDQVMRSIKKKGWYIYTRFEMIRFFHVFRHVHKALFVLFIKCIKVLWHLRPYYLVNKMWAHYSIASHTLIFCMCEIHLQTTWLSWACDEVCCAVLLAVILRLMCCLSERTSHLLPSPSRCSVKCLTVCRGLQPR